MKIHLHVCLSAVGSVVAFASLAGAEPATPFPMAHGKPLNVQVRRVSGTSEYQQFRVEFDGISGDRVPAYLYVPQAGAKPCPAVLLQYGIGGNKNTDYIVEIGQQFVAQGFIVLTIDAPMRGERKRPGTKRPLLGQFSRSLFSQYCGDYSRAVDYLASRPDVDCKRLCYMGISWGAITGVTYAANDPRIRVVASMVGGGNFAGLLSGWRADDGKKSIPSLDPVDNVARIAPRPLLMLNVTQDQLVPRPYAEALHKAAGKGAEVRWLETDHFFRTVNRQEVVAGVIRFIQRKLKAGIPSAAGK